MEEILLYRDILLRFSIRDFTKSVQTELEALEY